MFSLLSLENVRNELITEIRNDIDKKKLYISTRLNSEGVEYYPNLLLEIAESGTIESFYEKLSSKYFVSHEYRKSQNGGQSLKKVPSNANVTLCEGEFNKFYMRAVCVKAMKNNECVEVYRAKPVSNPRSESEALIGKILSASDLYKDLIAPINDDTPRILPAGPNSGLSIKLI